VCDSSCSKFNILGLCYALTYMGERLNIYSIESFKHNTCFLGGVILGSKD
jgi:hypothetical protein